MTIYEVVVYEFMGSGVRHLGALFKDRVAAEQYAVQLNSLLKGMYYVQQVKVIE